MTFSFNVFGGILKIKFMYEPTKDQVQELMDFFGKENFIKGD
jgi:hypothetical protein